MDTMKQRIPIGDTGPFILTIKNLKKNGKITRSVKFLWLITQKI